MEENSASTDDVLEVIRKKLKEANEKFKVEANKTGDSVNILNDKDPMNASEGAKYSAFDNDADLDEVMLNKKVSPEEEIRQNIQTIGENINEEFSPLADDSLDIKPVTNKNNISYEDSMQMRKEGAKKKIEANEEEDKDEPPLVEDVEEDFVKEELDNEDEDDESLLEEDNEEDDDIDMVDDENDEEEDTKSLNQDITDFRGEDYEDYIDEKKRSQTPSQPKSLEEIDKEEHNENHINKIPFEVPKVSSPLGNDSKPEKKETLNEKQPDFGVLNSRFSNTFSQNIAPETVPNKFIDEETHAEVPFKNNESLKEEKPRQNNGYEIKNDQVIKQDNNKNNIPNMDKSLNEDQSVNSTAHTENERQHKGFDSVVLEKIAHLIDKKLEAFTQKVNPLEAKTKSPTSLEDLILDALRPALEKWIDNNQDSILNIIEKVSEKYMAEAFSKTKAKK